MKCEFKIRHPYIFSIEMERVLTALERVLTALERVLTALERVPLVIGWLEKRNGTKKILNIKKRNETISFRKRNETIKKQRFPTPVRVDFICQNVPEDHIRWRHKL
jgi:hypothetical protein